MSKPIQDALRRLLALPLLVAPLAATAAGGDTYLVELLVFRHTDNIAVAEKPDYLRGFHELLEADANTSPEAPVARDRAGSGFRNIWTRLQRLDAYEPLAIMAFEQTQADYHPPVRVHDSNVIDEELHFPAQVIYVDLDSGTGLFEPYIQPLYRLDGSVQLRRSRFLHLDLDLEFRVEDSGLEDEGLEMLGPESADEDMPPAQDVGIFGVLDQETQTETEPAFLVHSLQQSRQVRTDTMHYFDSAFFGVLARVTAIDRSEE